MGNQRKEKALTMVRLNILGIGFFLLLFFLISVFICGIGIIALFITKGFKDTFSVYWGWMLIVILLEILIFWIGIIMVYATSIQLGVKMRIIGLVCGMIPLVHLIVLAKIIRITGKEYRFEKAKIKLDRSRAGQEICKTKYPLFMVHGVFFRDSNYFNYWGRIPGELEKNGAKIFYGNHQSALAVEESARELAERIKEIVLETGCQKVNIIAHSKGGLDSKTAVACLGISPYVASITTVNTPHRGCEYADYLLGKAPEGVRNKVAATYNATLRKLGDSNPDFIAAVSDLTTANSVKITEATSGFDFDKAGIYTQSVGSRMTKASSSAFPLNMSYLLVGHFDGPNDGLVGEESFKWGQNYTYVDNDVKRGISHADVIDLNRENIDGFDVREFYVNLVNGLKKRGL
ncbi:MAG: triacylglycerol lipase [Eubacterium sp.]|nr:triacylglycerol lipase [Eubacterium sp.]